MGTPVTTTATTDNNSVVEKSATEQATIDYEKRFKDTQSAFTKSQQLLKAKEAEVEALKKLMTPEINIPTEKLNELEDLKYSDPDTWHKEISKLEKEARDAHKAKITELTGQVSKEAEIAFEINRREQVLNDFNAISTVKLTPEVIDEDIPPRIKKKLENNEISFEEFLVEASTYLSTGKVVSNPETINQPNLNNVAGTSGVPSDTKPEASLSTNYKKAIF